ncbi:uncharacterized protein LOC105183324 isoform X2 [Harpegnathos saltator]|uniref:uncharacterized protein LOC105183324 isoform X2 n=1 Tax=Harpegnathos saltator TaxID=610380 RepID=UPI000948EFFC|nr:uncharacterized protein LOC105183324 isoform X2 [Harpegnathos saltator]
MICFDLYQHFNVNRLLLLAIGLWPYQQTKLARVQIILISSILISFIVLQLATFLTAECTVDLVINILSITFLFMIHLIKYNAFILKIKNVKYLIDQLEQICSELKNEKEIAIVENYAIVVKRYTIVILRTLIVLATGTMFVGYFKHICGIFRVASYRIEQAMDINVLKNINPKNEIMICKKIICAVDLHRQAMRSSKVALSMFEGMFFLLLLFGVSCLSLNLFRVFQIVTFEDNIEEFMLRIAFVITILMYIFLMNYIAQEVTDHNEHVFEATYNIRWYIAPLHIQKMILFLLQKGTKAFTLNLGGLFVASLESASMLASASVSYFTILYSTRQ